MIQGTVSYKPLKGGYIAVELEVEDTLANRLALALLHKTMGSLFSQQELDAMPQLPADQVTELDLAELVQMADRLFSRLLKLKYPKTDDIPIISINTDDVKNTAEALTAPDEIPATHNANKAFCFSLVDIPAPENEFYGEK
jgi:hypothetical protein